MQCAASLAVGLSGMIFASSRRRPSVRHTSTSASTSSRDLRFAMGRGRSYPQPLGPLGDGRIVDRLDIDRVPLKQHFAGRAAFARVADEHRDDVRRIVHHRQPGGAQRVLDELGHLLVALALDGRAFQCRTAAAALAATLGGRVEVKMNEGAKLLTASTIASLAAM